jgi:hypothetical protein
MRNNNKKRKRPGHPHGGCAACQVNGETSPSRISFPLAVPTGIQAKIKEKERRQKTTPSLSMPQLSIHISPETSLIPAPDKTGDEIGTGWQIGFKYEMVCRTV